MVLKENEMEGGRDKATPHNFYRILVDSGLGESRWLCGRPSAGMPYPILSNEFEGPVLCMGLSMRRPSEATLLASFVAQKVAVSLGMRASCLSDNFAPLRLLSLSLFLSPCSSSFSFLCHCPVSARTNSAQSLLPSSRILSF